MGETTKTRTAIEKIDISYCSDFLIGHAHDKDGITGCTVIICNKTESSVSGIDVRGGLPGTRNSDAGYPMNDPQCCNAVLLSGGSYFGLNAAGGVERFLEEKHIGYEVRGILVPCVMEAIIFDLAIGDSRARPDANMGYQACVNAWEKVEWKDGSIGAGIGATVGKCKGMEYAMKGGTGSYCLKNGDLYVGAIMVVNAVGDIYDPTTSRIIAGALDDTKSSLIDSEEYILENYNNQRSEGGNTTIGVILTNAKLTKAEACKISAIGHDGLARTIRPVHTMSDGDTLITLATGEVGASRNVVEIMAVKAIENAIKNAIICAVGGGTIRSYNELFNTGNEENEDAI